MDHNDIFLCSLSGVEAPEEAILPDQFADDLGLMPVGWTRIEVQRRLPNPEYSEVQQVKHGLISATMESLPEKDRRGSARAVEIQVAAQFAQLEANLSPFINVKEVIFVAPPEMDKALADEFFEIRDRLGLPIPLTDEDGDIEDEEAEDAEIEAAPATEDEEEGESAPA
jgi:hypothetical protein